MINLLPTNKKERVIKIKNKKKLIFIIFILTMLLILIFAKRSLGKATSKPIVEGKTEIARPIINVESSKKINITNQNKSGEYIFKVKNYDENVTDVDMEYYIEILNKIDKNIDIKLYKNDELIDINDNKTKIFDMPKASKKEDIFKMKIEYKNSDKSVEDVVEQLQVKVHSQQKQA